MYVVTCSECHPTAQPAMRLLEFWVLLTSAFCFRWSAATLGAFPNRKISKSHLVPTYFHHFEEQFYFSNRIHNDWLSPFQRNIINKQRNPNVYNGGTTLKLQSLRFPETRHKQAKKQYLDFSAHKTKDSQALKAPTGLVTWPLLQKPGTLTSIPGIHSRRNEETFGSCTPIFLPKC